MSGEAQTTGPGRDDTATGSTILCGTELHVRVGEVRGMHGMIVEWVPACGPDGRPAGDEMVNNAVAGICREQILYHMEDMARDRLMELAEKDGGSDRLLYRLVVTAREPAGDPDVPEITDQIDPAFTAIDAGLSRRAGVCRGEIAHILAGDYSTKDQENEKTGKTFEILKSSDYKPVIRNRTEEEARRAILAGEECLLIEMQVIGIAERNHGKDSIGFDYVAAISQKALSSPWIQEKIGTLSDV